MTLKASMEWQASAASSAVIVALAVTTTLYFFCRWIMSMCYRCPLRKLCWLAAAGLTLLALATEAEGGQTIPAGFDLFATLPGDASVTIPGIGVIPLEGATDFSVPAVPLTP